MRFSLAASLFAAVASVAADSNIVTLVSLDDIDRTVYITPNAGVESVDPVNVTAGASVDVEVVSGFVGNLYAIQYGAENTAGMLAEFNFQAWGDLTFFDVSAIVDPSDKDNVHEMYPYDSPNTPVSGCTDFPCDNAYYLPDDIQTKSTDQTHIVVTLGTNGSSSKRSTSKRSGDDEPTKSVARNFVIEKY